MPPGRKRKNPLPVEATLYDTAGQIDQGLSGKRQKITKGSDQAQIGAKGSKVDQSGQNAAWNALILDKPELPFKDSHWKAERERIKLLHSGTTAQK